MLQESVSSRLKSKVYLSGFLGGALAKMLTSVSWLATIWLLSKNLSAARLGDFFIAATIVEILILLTSGGLSRVVVFRVSRLPGKPGDMIGGDLVSSAVYITVLVGVSIAFLISLISSEVGAVIGKPGVGIWLKWLAWTIPLSSAAEIYAAWLRSRQRAATAALIGSSLPRFCSLLLITVACSFTTEEPIIAGCLVLGPCAALAAFLSKHPIPARLTRGELNFDDLSYGAKMGLTALVNRGIWKTDILLIGVLATSETAAQYGVAMQLAVTILFGHDMLNAVLGPRVGFLLERDSRDELNREYNQSRSFSFWLGLGVTVFICLFGNQILALFSQGEGAYRILMVLCTGYLSTVAFGMSGNLLSMSGHAGWTLLFTSSLLVLNTLLNTVLIPRWGGIGAAIATSISILLINLSTLFLVARLERMRVLGWVDFGILSFVVAPFLLVGYDPSLRVLVAIWACCYLVTEAIRQRRAWRYSLAAAIKRGRDGLKVATD